MGNYRITLDFRLDERLDEETESELDATLNDADIVFSMLEQLGIEGIDDEHVLSCVGDFEYDPRMHMVHWKTHQ